MKAVSQVVREMAGLFFDDGSLAFTVLAILGLTAAATTFSADAAGPATMVFLVGGVVAALLENVNRTAQASASRS